MLREGFVVNIVPRHRPDLVVDVAGGKAEDGNRLHLWSWNGTDAQRFRVVAGAAPDTFGLEPLCAPGMRVDCGAEVHGKDGTFVATTAAAATRGKAQSWSVSVIDARMGWAMLHSAADPDRVLDVAASGEKKARLLAYTRHGSWNQQFRFVVDAAWAASQDFAARADGGMGSPVPSTPITTATQQSKSFSDQEPGTSGLRKKVVVFDQANYVENFVQATLEAVAEVDGGVPEILVVGGDGRYLSESVCQIIVRMAAANGVKKVLVGLNTLMSTPAVSAVVRSLPEGTRKGAFILTASHNPGGPGGDFGIKYNMGNGGPAPKKVTDLIFAKSKAMKEFRTLVGAPIFPLHAVGKTAVCEGFELEVIDSVAIYAAAMQQIFDFDAIKALVARPDFAISFDAMHGASGPYARKVLVEMLGAPAASVKNAVPSPDFGGGHPDPNLTYAADLVKEMGLLRDGSVDPNAPATVPAFGAACDGDGDRNMILGAKFFVSPSDSVAIISANANAIPYFKQRGGLKAVARSMPTSGALDLVAKKLGVPCFEVPTGWKFFGNLMDSKALFGKEDYTPLICGEESFGTGSDHVREKDGLWAVLAWLNILADRNRGRGASEPLVTVKDVVEAHWREFGRNYYCRYDYEEVSAEGAQALMAGMRAMAPAAVPPLPTGEKVATLDDFAYTDPVDESVATKQGIRVVYSDGSRFVLRLSGTGSVGATIRLYLEQYMAPALVAKALESGGMPTGAQALEPLVKIAVATAGIEQHTGRKEPTVIT